MELSNKKVVIVGASSGLGKSLAEIISKETAKLFLLSRKPTAKFENSTYIELDITNPEKVKEVFDKIEDIDILINCAGVGLTGDLRDASFEEIDKVIDTDLKGAIYVCQAAYKVMAEKKSGYIINVVSTSGLRARPMETIYCAAKWGLRGFTQSLKLAGDETGVKVSGVYPGGMRSENFWKIDPGRDISEYLEPAVVAQKIVDLIKGEYQEELIIERPKK